MSPTPPFSAAGPNNTGGALGTGEDCGALHSDGWTRVGDDAVEVRDILRRGMTKRRYVVALACVLVACKTEAPAPAPSASAARHSEPPPEPQPSGCKAKGPTVLGTVTGDVYGLAGDATHLYCVTWDIYGSRGDLSQIRKDGLGMAKLTSLTLEPRGLALDGATAFYTSGIRLMAIPKAGGDEKTLVPIFSSQYIAVHGPDVYGVPGDYGPYDRLAKVPKVGGEPKELGMGKRPTRDGTKGWSRVAADDSGAYVTDSGNDRVIAFPLGGGKARIVAHAARPFDLVIVGAVLVFDLAKKGDLLAVAKSGGSPKKLAGGLAKEAHFAADEKAAYVPVAGKTEDDPVVLSRVPMTEGEPAEVARVTAGRILSTISLDADCVYWTERESSSKSIVYAAPR